MSDLLPPLPNLNAQTKLRAPFPALRSILGEPDDDDGDKVSTSWRLELEGVRIHVADHQEDPDRKGPACRRVASYDWTVSAADDAKLAKACKALSAKVVAAVIGTGARSLSSEDRDRLNALIKTGVKLADAMKQVRLTLNEEEVKKRFAWPIGATEKKAKKEKAPKEPKEKPAAKAPEGETETDSE